MHTETQNQKTLNIDTLPTAEIVQIINDEDKTVAAAVEKTLPAIAEAIDAIVEGLRAGGRLIYVGAGTSGRLGVLDAVECVPTYSTPPELVQGLIAGGEQALTRSVEGAEDKPELAKSDLQNMSFSQADILVGIAASGRTPYVLGALEYARDLGAKTIAISCNVPAPILDAADIGIDVAVGAEVVTGSTRMKAGTAQKMILNMLSTGSMIRLGKVYGNLMVDVQVTNAKLADRANRIVQQIANVDEETAQSLLESAHNHVKTALVMHIKQVDYETALQLLHDNDGYLRQVIG
ncbi:MAG: N-acetylmuramic acid 6-phosphate etherase [Anaerolineae bacterium]|nr:N-acetylmuramic acid 6-phosphate etherase [Anaerolineae bacterium]MDQ7034868.1 N-acetylmuramic acid 6-phosphate etherase [Anaerolineae bacterium]